LFPVFLLHPNQVQRLFFKMVSSCPALFVQTRSVSLEIKLRNLSQQVRLILFGVTAQVVTPASKVLSESRTHKVPPVNYVSASNFTTEVPPGCLYKRTKVVPF
jgi:hypothetical protein